MKQILSSDQKAIWLGRKASQVNFALVIHLLGYFPVDLFHEALNKVIRRHVLFFIRLDENEKGQLFYTSDSVPEVPLRIISSIEGSDWQQVVQEELGRPFDYKTGPLVRFVLIQEPDSQDLIIVCDHGVSDGLSAVYLVRDLLNQMGNTAREAMPLPVPPDIWDLAKATMKKSLRVKIQLAVFSSFFKLSHWMWRITKQNTRELRSNIPSYTILSTQLLPLQTAKLIERCRKEQTTVHAALCTAWALAQLRSQENRRTKPIIISVPVSLRDRLPDDAREIAGFFISTVEAPVNISPENNFWEAARQFKHQLMQSASDETIFLRPLMAKSMFTELAGTVDETFIPTFVNQQIHYDFSITNLGRLNLLCENKGFQIGAVYGPIVNAYEKERTVGICTFNNILTMTFTARDSRLSRAEAVRMMDQVNAILAEQCQASKG